MADSKEEEVGGVELKQVSPTLHPINISRLVENDADAGVVNSAVRAFTQAYEGIAQVKDAREKLQRDATRTDLAKVLHAAQLGEKVMENIRKSFESSWNTLEASEKLLLDKMNKPLQQAAGAGAVPGEIRTHFKYMKHEDRMKKLVEAVTPATFDEQTASSILGAPAYLSGLSDEEAGYATRLYHILRNPGMGERLQVVRAAKEKLLKARPIVHIEMEKAIGAKRHEIDRLRAANSEADAALIVKQLTQPTDEI